MPLSYFSCAAPERVRTVDYDVFNFSHSKTSILPLYNILQIFNLYNRHSPFPTALFAFNNAFPIARSPVKVFLTGCTFHDNDFGHVSYLSFTQCHRKSPTAEIAKLRRASTIDTI